MKRRLLAFVTRGKITMDEVLQGAAVLCIFLGAAGMAGTMEREVVDMGGVITAGILLAVGALCAVGALIESGALSRWKRKRSGNDF